MIAHDWVKNARPPFALRMRASSIPATIAARLAAKAPPFYMKDADHAVYAL